MPAWQTSSQLPQRMHRSSSTLPVSGSFSPPRIASPRWVSICGSRIFESWKIGHTVLHSPQLTQWSARAAADCGVSTAAAPVGSSGGVAS